MFSVRLDGLDDQVELVGAVHLARHTVEDIGFEGERFGEIVKPIDPACGMVLHEEDGTTAAFRSREQEQMIGAEVEHG